MGFKYGLPYPYKTDLYDYNSLNNHLTPLQKQKAMFKDIFSLVLNGMEKTKTDNIKLSNYDMNQMLAEIANRFTTLKLIANCNLIDETNRGRDNWESLQNDKEIKK